MHPGISQHTLQYLFAFRIAKVAVDMKLKAPLSLSFLDPFDLVDLAFSTGFPDRWWWVTLDSRFQWLSCSPN